MSRLEKGQKNALCVCVCGMRHWAQSVAHRQSVTAACVCQHVRRKTPAYRSTLLCQTTLHCTALHHTVPYHTTTTPPATSTTSSSTHCFTHPISSLFLSIMVQHQMLRSCDHGQRRAMVCCHITADKPTHQNQKTHTHTQELAACIN